jgi:hypothetical protein
MVGRVTGTPNPICVTATAIDGRIWLRVYRGRELVVETLLRPKQALLLASDLLNPMTIAAKASAMPPAN